MFFSFAFPALLCLALPALGDPNLGTLTAPQVKPWEVPYMDPEPDGGLAQAQIIALLRAKIKYIFIIAQENRSFDAYFGTFPGAAGLYAQPPSQTPGYYQPILNTDGTATTITPFLIGPAQDAWDIDDLQHSHAAIAAKLDPLPNGAARMDKFAEAEELSISPAGNPTLQAEQFGELAMAHEDCNTVPFLWNYADRFVLFDHVFQDMAAGSTPGDLALFAAQSGQTQLALHPTEAAAEPVLSGAAPISGSPLDPLKNLPANPGDTGAPQRNQTYASLALSLVGGEAQALTSTDADPADDLADIRDDIAFLAQSGERAIPWGWYQEGYDKELTDSAGSPARHVSYVTDHDAPQYFGYIANNAAERANLHGLGDFFTAIGNGQLPASGGVFYLKGGEQNLLGLKPANPLPAVQANFLGDDDHPDYSDSQISEAMVAKAVNAIAQSQYWPASVIILTWADGGGAYDHMPPPVLRDDENHRLESFGPRVPLIVISPYARVHQVAPQVSSQSSVVKLIDAIFARDPLAELPDEEKGFALGAEADGNPHFGPLDADPDISALLPAFDAGRLTGALPMLPPSYAEIPEATIMQLPHDGGHGCKVLGIVPQDFIDGVPDDVPADFNPLPKTSPTPPPV